MFLLKKVGPSLAAILILSVLALAFVILQYEQNGIILPSFSAPAPAETTAEVTEAPAVSANNGIENIIVLTKEEFKNE